MSNTDEISYIDLNLEFGNINDNIITNEFSLFLQEIELAIKIAPGEIWGMSDSIDIGRYVFNKYITISQIKNEITSYILRNCHHATYFNSDIDVKLLNIEGKDLVYIEINIIGLDQLADIQNFKQKFLLGA